MAASNIYPEPSRPADLARLEISKFCIENGNSFDMVAQRSTEVSAKVLDVERVGIWLFAENKRCLRCIDLFESFKAVHSQGATLQTREFPDYFAALESQRTLPAEVAAFDIRTSVLTAAYLEPLGITSLLDAPIYLAGSVIGVLCCEHIGQPREWTTEQRDFASSMADLLAVKIRAAETLDLLSMVQVQSTQLQEVKNSSNLAATAAGIAHDFRNVLLVMIGNAELIVSHHSCPPVLANFARQIQLSGEKAVELATTFVEFANPGPSSSRVILPSKVIAAQLPMLKSIVGERYRVEMRDDESRGRILIDPGQLERVVLNLVVNARDSMPDGGTVSVSTKFVSAADDDGKLGQFFEIAVEDRGTGIPPEVLPRIFEPYFTTKPRGRGTGVGLAVVQQIVNYSGGFIRIDSTVGAGTAFRVYLPRISNG